MEPMKPMKPMEPMKPMAPMKPMIASDSSWWPRGLDGPSSTGEQDGLRYAFFPDQKRLAVARGEKVELYDTGTRQINGISQASGSKAGDVRFTDQAGEVELASLKRVDAD
ncbi:hypothetical protein [Variovorax sp. KK3]|uniref:hypothetical protein n=1 Tax=Variovorax sp. KK3 TaxID=1855728 RepID=UPI00097BB2C8|nr:hypothetical protein [Variovorax sp. KK3]